jgi:hypothetical protein
MRKTSSVAVIVLLAFSILAVPFATGQQSGSSTSPAAVPSILEKYKALVGKWRTFGVKVPARFELVSIEPHDASSAKALISNYTVGGRPVDNATMVLFEEGRSTKARITLNEGFWDLTLDRKGSYFTGVWTWSHGGQYAPGGAGFEKAK